MVFLLYKGHGAAALTGWKRKYFSNAPLNGLPTNRKEYFGYVLLIYVGIVYEQYSDRGVR